MHASTDLRNLKCFDGLHYSFDILKYNYKELYNKCSLIKDDNKNLTPVLSMCWSIIDSIHRIREISQAIPGISKRNRELKFFLNETKLAENYRHYIQHLREELLKKDMDQFPVWGSLAWVDSKDDCTSHSVIFGTPLEKTNYNSCIYDNFNKKWVSRVVISINGSTFNFDPLYEESMRFKDFILPWIKSNFQFKMNIKNELPIFSASFGSIIKPGLTGSV